MNPADYNTSQNIDEHLQTNQHPGWRLKGKKTMAAIIVVILLILGLVWFVLAYDPVSPLDTVQLSNGKKISLRQTVSSLQQTLGQDLERDTDDPSHFNYPAKVRLGRLAVEASIFTDNKRVTGIRIVKNVANKQQQSSVHLGLTASELTKLFSKPPAAINQKLANGSAKGFRNQNARKSSSYYLVNPCVQDDKIVTFMITLKQAENKVLGAGAGCNSRGN